MPFGFNKRGIKIINVGLIGCGRISKKHFEAISKLDGIRCLACCDIIAERARSAAQTYDIPYWTTDYEEMLRHKDIDIIAVCTPSGLHPWHGIQAARYGKHLLVEKPIAVRVKQAEHLIRYCNRRVNLHVSLQNRLNRSIQLLRTAYNEGRFGKIYMILANVLWNRPQSYYDMDSWRGTWALDGGAFMNQACHYVDMVQWFGGPVESVTSLTATMARTIETEDTGGALIRFNNGIIGSINVTMLVYPNNMEGSITILGENGTVKVGGIAMNKIEHWEFGDRRDYDHEVSLCNSEVASIYGEGHQAYYAQLVKSMSNSIDNQIQENQGLVDGIEGRKSLLLIEAIYRSSLKKRRVNIRG